MNINKWTGTGRLTKDPELRELPTGTSVCELRIANDRMGRKQDESGFISVDVYGKSAESCARYLARGSRVAIDARLEYHEWEDGKRHDYRLIANTVEFLSPRDSEPNEAGAEAPEAVSA
jgi:single-strand DNA-binding protein